MSAPATIGMPVHGEAAGISFLRRLGDDNAVPLMLLHGIGSNAATFAPVMSALPMSIDAIAWNAPGYADSRPLVSGSAAPCDYAGALKTLLEALHLSRIVLAGHSLGALFATAFAAEYPASVAGLALISPALGYRVVPGAPLPAGVQDRIDEIQSLGTAVFAANRAPRLLSRATDKPLVLAAVERAMASVNLAGYVQAVRALGAGDLIADAALITAPAMVAVGTEDVVTPPDSARKAHQALSFSTGYYEITGAGHALPQEEPNIVADILVEFIEQHANV